MINNDCKCVHETIVRDIFDVVNDIKDFDQVEWLRKKNSVGSIAKRSSNLVLIFPVIVSNTLSIETAMIISKAIERKCTSLLQILFSSMQLTDVDNMQDYIKQFHTNLDLKGNAVDLDDFFDAVDKMSESGQIKFTDKDIYEAVKEDMQNINFYLSTEFNPVSINDYKMRRNMYGESGVYLEAKGKSRNINFDYSGNNGCIGNAPKASTLNQFGDLTVPTNFGNMSNTTDSNNHFNSNNRNVTNNYYGNRNNSNDITMSTKDATDYFKTQLLPSDVNKANELMPTTMLVNFINVNDKGRTTNMTGVVGVKAKLYPVDSMDIINRVSSKYSDKNGLFNLVRATTREISFFRDLAFAIDKAKLDAFYMASDSNNARMFKVLERRAAKNKFSALIKKNDASPITSLVISQDEVEYLKKYHNLDIDKAYNARTILNSYNLMDIVVADESLEIARFLFDDGDNTYETLSFDSLEKQAKDNSYKKIINLMSKVNR